MEDERKIKSILHAADSETLEKIAEKHISVDNETSQRMYERLVGKMNKNNNEDGYSIAYNAEPVKRTNMFRYSGIAAACLAVIAGTILTVKNMKAPELKPEKEIPVFFTESTETRTLTSSGKNTGITVSIKTTAEKTKSTEKSEKPDTTTEAIKTTSAKETAAKATEGHSVSTTTPDPQKTTVTTTKKPASSAEAEANNDGGSSQKTTSVRYSSKTTTKNSGTSTTTASTTKNTGTFKPVTSVKTTAVTTNTKPPENDDFYFSRPRARAVMLGDYPADSPRLSYAELMQLTSECTTRDELLNEIMRRYPYPDYLWGSGIDYRDYYFDDEGVEVLTIAIDGSAPKFNYHRVGSTDQRAILLESERRQLEDIKSREALFYGYLVRERAIAAGQVHPQRPRITLERYRELLDESSSFKDFWYKLEAVEPYPDRWGGSGTVALSYYLDGDDSHEIVVVPDSGLVMYCNKESGECIEMLYENRGETLAADVIDHIIGKMNYVIISTEQEG